VAKNQGNESPRRFDHVFASQALHATEATYLHKYDDLSNHTPLEVVFTPQDGLREVAEVIDCGTFSPSGNRTVDASSPSMSNDRLNYEDDVRTVDPDANYRRGRFDRFVRPLENRGALFAGWFGPIRISALFYVTVAHRLIGHEIVWTVTSLVVASSVLVHGVMATPLTKLFGQETGPIEPQSQSDESDSGSAFADG